MDKKRGWILLVIACLTMLSICLLVSESGVGIGVPRYVSHITNKLMIMTKSKGNDLSQLVVPAWTRELKKPNSRVVSPGWPPQPPPPRMPIAPGGEVGAVTSPIYSRFYIANPKPTYAIGDQIKVLIETRTDSNTSKTVGGDFIRAKLFCYAQMASSSTDGEVNDLQNGWYEATFTARWPGKSKIDVVIVHSAEALGAVQKIAQQYPAKMVYIGKFIKGTTEESRKCNAIPPETNEFCNFTSPVSGVPWFCQKPIHPSLHCDHWRWSQSDEPATGKLQRILLDHQGKDYALMRYRKHIENDNKDTIINVEADDSTDNAKPDLKIYEFPWQNDNLPPCRPGQHIGKPHPSGYFYHDTWYSLHCRIRRRWTPWNVTACLHDTTLHVIGDSSARQIYRMIEFILKDQFTSSRTDFLHESEQRSGPLWSRDEENRIELRFNFHGFPIGGSNWFNRSNIVDVAERLDSMKNSSRKLVILMTIGAHFTFHSLEFYENRLRIIRAAIDRLFQRIPNAMVIVKSMTAREHSNVLHIAINSEWWMWRLDQSLRQVLVSHPKIALVDAWDMTKAMLYPYNVHPPEMVIANFVSHIMSYICPMER